MLLVTFPPSTHFEPCLHTFLQRTAITEGRTDVLAKHRLKHIVAIRKGVQDAAFHPSTFGEPLDAVFRLQERVYPKQKVPIVLPLLADGVLALSGTKAQGIFRVPGDSDAVAALKMRLDRGSYTLEGVDDPHISASLFQHCLRELVDPLIPSEMYNDCIVFASDAEHAVPPFDGGCRQPTAAWC